MKVSRTGRRKGREQPSGTGRRVRLSATLGWLAVGGLVLAACGGGGPATSATTGRQVSSTSAPRSTPTSTTDPATAAVLAAYRAGWAAYEGALADANAADPALAATMVDPLLQKVKANLYAYQRQGIVGRGPVVLHPKVAALSASSATVVDCTFSSSALVYRATGKPVPPVTAPEHDGVRATLVLSGGTWKVSQQSVSEGKCAPGS